MRQINERERGKTEAANHLMLVNCFTIEMLNDRQLYSVKQTTRLFFLKYAHFGREREREIKCACVNYLHLFVCPYKQ